MLLNEFLQDMERVGVSGKPKYVELTQQRIEDSKKYEAWLNAKPLVLNNINYVALGDFIYNLTAQQLQKLNQEFSKPTSKIIVNKPQTNDLNKLVDGSFEVYTPEKLIFELIEMGEIKAIEKLIQKTDIALRKEFADARPLHYLINQKPQYYNYILDKLFDSLAIKKLLASETESDNEANIFKF